MDERTQLIRFAETAEGFDVQQRLKLILFAAGVKPATFVVLKINPKNLDEKQHFEQHLDHNNVFYEVSRPKSYEEMSDIKGNSVRWKMNGVWLGYDLFHTKEQQKSFHQYQNLLRQGKHGVADRIAAKLYGYPPCCVKEYTREHDPQYLKKKYSYYQFYERMHEQHKSFPFVAHYVCRCTCRATKKVNQTCAAIIKKSAPSLWKAFTSKKTFVTDVIVDAESDVFDDNARSLWPEKDGHEYSLICRKPIEGHYYMFSHLTRAVLLHGVVASAKIKVQYDYADVTLMALKDFMKDFHHERKFLGG